MLYYAKDLANATTLATATARGRLRRIASRLYTDDLDMPSDEWVRRHLLAVLALLYPGWFISHSTAALGYARNGVAFISSAISNVKTTAMPGVAVKRIRQFTYPETVAIDTGVVSKRTLTGSEEPVMARMSSPLQAVFEVLRRDSRQPERSLPEAQIRALVDHLSRTDRQRAARFAERNGLRREFQRFLELESSLDHTVVPQHPGLGDLEVYFYHYRVGRLTRLTGNEVRFEYDRDWMIELSGLPIAAIGTPYEGPELPAFFDNLLPEGWAQARLRAVYKIAKDDAYALLRATPKYLSNVTLRPANLADRGITLDELTASLSEVLPEREGWLPVIEEIGGDPDTRELWNELRRRGATGLSGVQAKLPVHLFEAGGKARISLGHLGNTSTHILKLPSPDYPELVPNAWATMELARRVGLEVADLRQVRFQEGSPLKEHGLLIERFDLPDRLVEAESLPLLEDIASLLGLRRRDKYSASLEQVADALVKVGLDENGFRAFFDHVVYSWITGNGDLHAKNIAVLHQVRPGRLGAAPERIAVRYSPLYDLLNTRVAIRGDRFALPLNGKHNGLRRKDFVVLARRLGWDSRDAETRVGRIAERVEEHLDMVVRVSGLSGERQSRFLAIVEENLRGLRG